MSQNILTFACGRGVYRVSTLKESRRRALRKSIRLPFSIQNNFYYVEPHKMRGDDDVFARNITAELDDHIFLCHTRTSY